MNPLFAGVVLAVASGIAAGLLAGDESLLGSNLVFRVAVGGVVAIMLYAVAAALWLAWHRRLFKRVGVGPASIEPGGDGMAEDITARDLEVAEFMGATTNAIDELRRRVEAIEREAGGVEPPAGGH